LNTLKKLKSIIIKFDLLKTDEIKDKKCSANFIFRKISQRSSWNNVRFAWIYSLWALFKYFI